MTRYRRQRLINSIDKWISRNYDFVQNFIFYMGRGYTPRRAFQLARNTL